MDIRTIPIFPMDLVLFPRQELSVNVFEPRYKQLVEDCTMGDCIFGVCLTSSDTVLGWQTPVDVGVITKIIRCQDADLDGLHLNIDTVSRGRFRILDILPPCVAMPSDYDPTTLEGHRRFQDGYDAADGKMYIRARVEMLPEIDSTITESGWRSLVDAWKQNMIRRSGGRADPDALDQILRQYYLLTNTPTMDYVYSLAALGASSPVDLQPILEADSIAELTGRVMALMERE